MVANGSNKVTDLEDGRRFLKAWVPFWMKSTGGISKSVPT